MKPVQKLEKMLGIETTYYFTINRVKTFVDTGDTTPLEHDNLELIMASEPTLKDLGKKIKQWIKDKKAGFIEQETISPTLFLTFDTPDLTIYATVHAQTNEGKKDVHITGNEVSQLVKILDKKRTPEPSKRP